MYSLRPLSAYQFFLKHLFISFSGLRQVVKLLHLQMYLIIASQIMKSCEMYEFIISVNSGFKSQLIGEWYLLIHRLKSKSMRDMSSGE